jgi:HD-like signal output (HDOD) protein
MIDETSQDKESNSQENTAGKILIPLDGLRTGMLLAEDLRDFNGRLILEEGTCLTPKFLRIFKMWGITEAPIRKSGIMAEEPDYYSKKEDVDPDLEARAKEIFRFTNRDSDFIQILFNLYLQKHKDSKDFLTIPPEQIGVPVSNLKPGKFAKIDVREHLDGEIKLPSLPDIVVRINEAINNPSCTSTHIAGIIKEDSSLTARLLKLVNSAFYNFPMPIDSIPRAVTIIGSKQISELALGTAVISTFENIPNEIVNMKSFWKHSVACGIISRLLAGYRKLTNTESFFLAGLLHDLGRLIFYLYFPVQAKEVFHQSFYQETPREMVKVEADVLGMDHAEMGGVLIKKWKLPPILEMACLYHHEPQESPDPVVSGIIHTANIIANAMRLGSSGEFYVAPLNDMAWKNLGLSNSIIHPIMQQTERILDETVKTYFNGSSS